MTDDAARKAFEDAHLGGNKRLAHRNTTTGDYVLASIQDAYAGWQAALQYAAKMRAQEEPVAWHIVTEENACLVHHISLDNPIDKTWMRWPIRSLSPLILRDPPSEPDK